jgi:uncharacterized protein YdeI (YjbR/CyaY-like superfamily)
MTAASGEETVHPLALAEWRKWLLENHRRPKGVWVVTYKKATGRPRVEYDELVTEALCFGWIDSKPRKLDAPRTMLWLSPRKSGSAWSRLNKERVGRAFAEGRMHAAGLAKIEAAKRDGSWNALDSVDALEVPHDLARALKRYARAASYFDAFPPSVKRGILEWIGNASTAPTRRKRIDETARLAARNERANQWRPPPRERRT